MTRMAYQLGSIWQSNNRWLLDSDSYSRSIPRAGPQSPSGIEELIHICMHEQLCSSVSYCPIGALYISACVN